MNTKRALSLRMVSSNNAVRMHFAVTWICLCITYAHSFYLPADPPVTYCQDQLLCRKTVKVYANTLISANSAPTYDYRRFPFCQTRGSSPPHNLGQVLIGDRIVPTPLELNYGEDVSCRMLCEKEMIIPGTERAPEIDKSTSAELEATSLLMKAIEHNYNQQWILDNLPVQLCYQIQGDENGALSEFCAPTFPIGCHIESSGQPSSFCQANIYHYPERETYYLFNHVTITITYQPIESASLGKSYLSPAEFNPGRIISAKLFVSSVQQKMTNGGCDISRYSPQYITRNESMSKKTIGFSYSVKWLATDTKWSYRWDRILNSSKNSVLWFSLMNSGITVLFLTGMLVAILKRVNCTTRCTMESQRKREFGMKKEAEWTLIHGDLFRSPAKKMLLSAFLGNGVQLLMAALLTIFCACIGFLSPANRGFLMTCSVVCYVLMGTPAGYSSSRIYKIFGGVRWKSNALLTAFLVPGMFFVLFFIVNLMLWGERSSGALPIGTIATILALWFFISAPLSILGAYLAIRRPSRIANQEPDFTPSETRLSPRRGFPVKEIIVSIVGGFLPFGAIFLDLFFILQAIWFNGIYYQYGILLLKFLVLIIECAEVSALISYYRISTISGESRWGWRSLAIGGVTGVYVFLYSVHFWATKTTISDPSSVFYFFAYNLAMAFALSLIIGCIGFFATYWFLRKMRSIVEVDYIHQPLSLEQSEVLGSPLVLLDSSDKM